MRRARSPGRPLRGPGGPVSPSSPPRPARSANVSASPASQAVSATAGASGLPPSLSSAASHPPSRRSRVAAKRATASASPSHCASSQPLRGERGRGPDARRRSRSVPRPGARLQCARLVKLNSLRLIACAQHNAVTVPRSAGERALDRLSSRLGSGRCSDLSTSCAGSRRVPKGPDSAGFASTASDRSDIG